MDTTRAIDFLNIGHEVRQAIREAKMAEGQVLIAIPKAGAAVLAMEPEAKTGEIKKGLETFLQNQLIRCFLPRSLILPVEKGRMLIEPWQEIFLIDYENSGKRREFRVQLFWEQKEGHEPES